MKLVLLSLRGQSESWVVAGENTYSEKIQRFVEFEDRILKSPKIERANQKSKIEQESALLKKQIPFGKCHLVILDEKGKSFDSLGFASVIKDWQLRGHKEVYLVMGGAYGLSDEIKSQAQQCLSLSTLTMNHWVAKIMVMEQIYRSFTIINGLPYHNE